MVIRSRKVNIIENLQHVVIGKFLYKCFDLEELRTLVLTPCNIKGDCQIDLLTRNQYVVIIIGRFVNLTLKATYYIKAKDEYSY